MRLLQQSSTARALTFLMVDSANHVTGKTGLSPTVTICKEGGSFGAAAGAVNEVANGWYRVAGNADDTDTLGSLLLHAEASGADPVDMEFEVVAFNPLDTVRLGLSALPAAAADGAGGLPISDAGGLDLDAKLANTHEVTAARMGALTDWIDGGRLDLLLDAVLADTGTDGVVLSSATQQAIAAALLDLAAGVETNRTVRQALRLILAASAGKLSGAATTTVKIRDTNDAKDRITATVDADGNRTAITLDAS